MSSRFEQNQSPELQELLQRPEEAFDSSLEKAEQEHRKVAERLLSIGETSHYRDGVEFQMKSEQGGAAPAIDIAWQVPGSCYGSLLRLEPIQEGKGVESGVIAYTGTYGLAAHFASGDWRYPDEAMAAMLKEKYPDDHFPPNVPQRQSLEQLFGVPEGMRLAIKPTATRWAAGQDELSVLLGENTRTMHMGLGFLLLPYGERYMLVGMHEAGHLSPRGQLSETQQQRPEENQAWQLALNRYAALHRPRKEQVQMRRTTGLFGLAKKYEENEWYEQKTRPSIGQIERYGLVSHYMADVAANEPQPTYIPESWKGEGNRTAKRTMERFGQEIERAHTAYTNFARP